MRTQLNVASRIGFYEKRAGEYFDDTRGLDLSALHDSFLADIPEGGLILDAGSGSGRDTRAFLERGYRVEAFDGSGALAKLSSRHTGISTEVLAFEAFTVRPGRYDGIWALASLLHVARHNLPKVVVALGASLKAHGAFFASFKAGHSDIIDDLGRAFTNLTPDTATRLFCEADLFEEVAVREIEAPAAFDRRAHWIHVKAKRRMA